MGSYYTYCPTTLLLLPNNVLERFASQRLCRGPKERGCVKVSVHLAPGECSGPAPSMSSSFQVCVTAPVPCAGHKLRAKNTSLREDGARPPGGSRLVGGDQPVSTERGFGLGSEEVTRMLGHPVYLSTARLSEELLEPRAGLVHLWSQCPVSVCPQRLENRGILQLRVQSPHLGTFLRQVTRPCWAVQ